MMEKPIKDNPIMSKTDKRKQMRILYTRANRKFEKDTNPTPKTRKKRKTKKNLRTTYITYEDFENAVRNTLPPLIKESAMSKSEFYVFPLKIFYEDSVLPPEYFVDTYKKKFGEAPINAIMYIGQGMPLLALGAVPPQV
ncbi:hypothetical protein LCGC14_2206490 [marine sediment metagenome]|uniref:Uncharacterized protein n=1 Tax=marine sediment metagenome TaxID=412755 RepID=A0A0F9DF32_9ZZZZ